MAEAPIIVQGSGERENAVLKRLTCLLLMLAHAAGASSPPNVVLIVADDLGFTDLGLYGSETPTPHLDRLGAEGVQLMNFHANASCTPSRAMLLSGRDNHAVGYGANPAAVRRMPELAARPGYRGAFPEGLALLPKRLQDLGYQTYFVGKWHLGSDPSAHPPAQGFEHSFYLEQGGGSHFADAVGTLSADEALSYWEDGMPVAALPEDFFSSTFYVDKALAYLDRAQRQDAPFLLQLSLTAPHWPLQAPEAWRDRFSGVYDEGWAATRAARLSRLGQRFPALASAPSFPVALGAWDDLPEAARREEARRMEIYAALIAHMDAELGRLFAALEASGADENTVVLFLSDNGPEGNDVMAVADNATWVPKTFDLSYEAMGAPGSYVSLGRGWGHVSAGPLNRYKSFLSEGGTRTPALLRYPGVLPEGLASDAFVAVTDVLPSTLAWAGAPAGDFDGVPLSPERLTSNDRGVPFALEIYGNRAVWDGPWKALWDFSTDHWQLYYLPTDPGEQTDLSRREPERLAALVAFWERYAEANQVFRFPRETGYGRYIDQRTGER